MSETPDHIIRALQASDAAEFQALRLQALAECPAAFVSSVEHESQLPIDTVAERLTPTPGRCVLGAFVEGALVGTVGLMRESHHKLAHKAFIWGVYVAPPARQQGLGRRLMEQALAQAAAMPGLRQVNLGVNARNTAARTLYEQLGFEPFGLERGFMLLNGRLEDEIHMVCVLPSGPQ